MHLLDLTLPTPAENLACDEALLDLCEEGGAGEVLRFWEPREAFVVVGYANKVASEVNLDACRSLGIPILRRCSGGGTVLQGPGCLNYSLILRIIESGPLQSVTGTNRFVMERNRQALAKLLGRLVQVQGFTDLTLGDLKFSGNAQRRRRHSLIFHGTFLLEFDLTLVEKVLAVPSRQPEYRQGRSHRGFLINLNLPAEAIKQAMSEGWKATASLNEVPSAAIARLARERYSRSDWNAKF
jgi:lipoate-protein ligase A